MPANTQYKIVNKTNQWLILNAFQTSSGAPPTVVGGTHVQSTISMKIPPSSSEQHLIVGEADIDNPDINELKNAGKIDVIKLRSTGSRKGGQKSQSPKLSKKKASKKSSKKASKKSSKKASKKATFVDNNGNVQKKAFVNRTEDESEFIDVEPNPAPAGNQTVYKPKNAAEAEKIRKRAQNQPLVDETPSSFVDANR